MRINLKTKIWLTICSIVLMFSFFTLFYFPQRQGALLVSNYESEVQNLANTVALGIKIAIDEQNFEGVQTAMEFVKDDPRLQFISMVQSDTVWNEKHDKFEIKQTVFRTFPEKIEFSPSVTSSDSLIVKRASFSTKVMSGIIVLGFNTDTIEESKAEVKKTSVVVSLIVLTVGFLIGLWLARTISIPILALRDAARRVGKGDLNQKFRRLQRDEIGQLQRAFNKMIDDLSRTRSELKEKNVVLSATNSTLNDTLSELKKTHAQLVQSEKMASLGELTAGIAHEIQNPLNFVNNFADLSRELIEEIKEERAKSKESQDDALVDEILSDIDQNLEKIHHHGKRADGIVKGMLQHSRASTGQKEPTDVNVLTDEYLRLAYHGLRAKDKSFNAELVTDFDENLPKIPAVPQDLGRVLLNLFTNAFYATQKCRQADESFKPVVRVSTALVGNSVEITVTDNGTGIPGTIIDKIFQPFFTTKPTGEGTGLGLSMSYDIAKAHGGELSVKNEPGGGCTFTIQLPIQTQE